MAKSIGRKENLVGWYHSHPGYGCWMSGIDCSTQMLNQQYQEPWLAIIIDPVRTCSAGKVEIGAFRTYPEGYKPPESHGAGEYQTIPLSKIEDFGVHAEQYYTLDVSVFKSSLDTHMLELLWNKCVRPCAPTQLTPSSLHDSLRPLRLGTGCTRCRAARWV